MPRGSAGFAYDAAMSVKPIPDGFNTLTPYLVIDGVDKAIEFYQRALGAELTSRLPGPDGRILNAQMRLGTSMFMLADEYPEWGSVGPLKLGGSATSTHIYVEDVESAWRRAIDAGAEIMMPLDNTFWGDRFGAFRDPFGHKWTIASHVRDLTPEEMQAGAEDAFSAAEAARE